MPEPNTGWRNWGDHPFVVFLGIVAAIISIITFFAVKKDESPNTEGKSSLELITRSETPAKKPEPIASTPRLETSSSPQVAVTSVVTFTLINNLGPNQVSEDVQVYIEGKLVANLTVNQQKPTTSTDVEVPRAGKYVYTVIADGYFVIDQFGQMQRHQGRGDGVIEVEEGNIFVPTITPHGLRLMPKDDM